jgi:hypothetical protein
MTNDNSLSLPELNDRIVIWSNKPLHLPAHRMKNGHRTALLGSISWSKSGMLC